MFPRKMNSHGSAVTKVILSEDGNFLLSAGKDHVANLYNVFTGKLLGDYINEKKQALLTFEVTHDNKYVILPGFIGNVCIFEFMTGKMIGHFDLKIKIFGSSISYGSKKLLFCGDLFPAGGTNKVIQYDLDLLVKRLKKRLPILEEHADFIYELRDPNIIRHVAFGYLNKRIFAGMDDGRLLEFDTELKVVKTHEPFQNEPINSITFSKKFEFIILTSKSGAKMLDYESFELLVDHRSDHPMRCAQISPIMYDSEKPMYHLIMGGGVDAHETA